MRDSKRQPDFCDWSFLTLFMDKRSGVDRQNYGKRYFFPADLALLLIAKKQKRYNGTYGKFEYVCQESPDGNQS